MSILDLDLLFCITENALSSSTVNGIHFTKLGLLLFEMTIHLLLLFGSTPLPQISSVGKVPVSAETCF